MKCLPSVRQFRSGKNDVLVANVIASEILVISAMAREMRIATEPAAAVEVEATTEKTTERERERERETATATAEFIAVPTAVASVVASALRTVVVTVLHGC